MPVKKTIAVVAFIGLFAITVVVFLTHSPRNTPVTGVVKERSSSVVNISTERIVPLQYHPYWVKYGGMFDNAFSQFQGVTVGTVRLNGLGSGVIVSGDGLIVTNAHVVNMASKIYVILSDGKASEAALVAINPNMDLALIKIEPGRKLKPIKLAKNIMVGETVISIGNPLGLENSVSVGVISGMNRKFSFAPAKDVFTGLIQTDASINQGSSGGALLNLDGELAGVNLAVIQNAQSIGFAIPSDKVRWMIEDYKEAKSKRSL